MVQFFSGGLRSRFGSSFNAPASNEKATQVDRLRFAGCSPRWVGAGDGVTAGTRASGPGAAHGLVLLRWSSFAVWVLVHCSCFTGVIPWYCAPGPAWKCAGGLVAVRGRRGSNKTVASRQGSRACDANVGRGGGRRKWHDQPPWSHGGPRHREAPLARDPLIATSLRALCADTSMRASFAARHRAGVNEEGPPLPERPLPYQVQRGVTAVPPVFQCTPCHRPSHAPGTCRRPGRR